MSGVSCELSFKSGLVVVYLLWDRKEAACSVSPQSPNTRENISNEAHPGFLSNDTFFLTHCQYLGNLTLFKKQDENLTLYRFACHPSPNCDVNDTDVDMKYYIRTFNYGDGGHCKICFDTSQFVLITFTAIVLNVQYLTTHKTNGIPISPGCIELEIAQCLQNMLN